MDGFTGGTRMGPLGGLRWGSRDGVSGGVGMELVGEQGWIY